MKVSRYSWRAVSLSAGAICAVCLTCAPSSNGCTNRTVFEPHLRNALLRVRLRFTATREVSGLSSAVIQSAYCSRPAPDSIAVASLGVKMARKPRGWSCHNRPPHHGCEVECRPGCWSPGRPWPRTMAPKASDIESVSASERRKRRSWACSLFTLFSAAAIRWLPGEPGRSGSRWIAANLVGTLWEQRAVHRTKRPELTSSFDVDALSRRRPIPRVGRTHANPLFEVGDRLFRELRVGRHLEAFVPNGTDQKAVLQPAWDHRGPGFTPLAGAFARV